MKDNKIKILGVVNQGGSSYHRCKLALTRLGELYSSDFDIVMTDFRGVNDDTLKDIDILFFNWDIPFQNTQLSIWAKKYDFKIICDIDDSVNLPFNHPDKWQEKNYTKIMQNMILADVVTTTTDHLAKEIQKLNNKVIIIPNYIPFGYGQFVPKEVKSDKIRIGILGSYSHLPDWLTLKDKIKRALQDKEVQEKAEFVVCGYMDDNEDTKKIWDEIVNVFSYYKGNVKVLPKIVGGRDVESYMDLYDGLDIVIAPLEDNAFNMSKSNLRIWESSSKKVVMLGNKVWLNKFTYGFSNENKPFFLLYNAQNSLYNWIKWFIKNPDRVKELKEQAYEMNGKISDYNKVTELRANTFKEALKIKDTKPEDVKIFSIIYTQNQVAEYETYDNSHIRTVEQNSFLFEYNPINNIIKDAKDDIWYGVFSYKFPMKTGIYSKLLWGMLRDGKYRNYDIINLCRRFYDGTYLKYTEEYHPGFMKLFVPLCKDLGLEVKEPNNVIYSNFHLTKGSIYKQFMNEIVNPAITLMDTKYKDLAFKDANYQSGLPKEQLLEYTGLEHYTFHAFILERLMSVWIENNKDLKIKNLF